MTRRHITTDEGGFSLVEVLVTMSVGIVVLIAVLGAFDRFASAQQSSSESIGAQDAARAEVRQIVGTLRQARTAPGETSPIPVAWATSRSDLVVGAYVRSATDPSPGSVAGWVRYCAAVDGARASLVVGVRAGDPYAAPGPCSAADTTNGWSHAVVIADRLLRPGQLFDFSGQGCTGAACLPAAAAIESVGVRVAVARRAGATDGASVIRDAVSFRNRLAQ